MLILLSNSKKERIKYLIFRLFIYNSFFTIHFRRNYLLEPGISRDRTFLSLLAISSEYLKFMLLFFQFCILS